MMIESVFEDQIILAIRKEVSLFIGACNTKIKFSSKAIDKITHFINHLLDKIINTCIILSKGPIRPEMIQLYLRSVIPKDIYITDSQSNIGADDSTDDKVDLLMNDDFVLMSLANKSKFSNCELCLYEIMYAIEMVLREIIVDAYIEITDSINTSINTSTSFKHVTQHIINKVLIEHESLGELADNIYY